MAEREGCLPTVAALLSRGQLVTGPLLRPFSCGGAVCEPSLMLSASLQDPFHGGAAYTACATILTPVFGNAN